MAKRIVITGFKGFRKGIDGKAYCKPSGSSYAVPFVYEQGKTYSENRLRICHHGFHFCQELISVNTFYRFGEKRNVFATVTALGKVQHSPQKTLNGKPKKSVTDKIRIDSKFYNFFQFLSFINYPHTGISSLSKSLIKGFFRMGNQNLQPDAVIDVCMKPHKGPSELRFKIVNCTEKRLRAGWDAKNYNIIIKKYQYFHTPVIVAEIQNK